MTKHATFVADDAVAAVVAAPAQAGRHFSSFVPAPIKGAAGGKKHAAVPMDLAAAGVVTGGSWLESMKASSPRRAAADAEHGDWMVRSCTPWTGSSC